MIKIVVVVLTIAYPVLVYFGLAKLGPGVFGAALAALMVARLVGLNDSERHRLLIPILAIMVYALAVAITGNPLLLRFYPVAVNALMLGLFAESLVNGPPLIERLARARGMTISKHGGPYIRRITWVWCGFFIINGTLAALTAVFGTLGQWALYNGLIAYLAMGVLMAGELLVRRWYKRRMALIDASGSG